MKLCLNLSARRLRAGFTLIELLVVIAIIAILAAILFPVFAQAKAAAKDAATLSNMKQAATSTLLYENDYDDTCPIVYGYDDANHYYSGPSVIQRLYPYEKSYYLHFDVISGLQMAATVDTNAADEIAVWGPTWAGTWDINQDFWDWNTTLSPNAYAFMYDANFPADGGTSLDSNGADMHPRVQSAQEFVAEQSQFSVIRADYYPDWVGALRFKSFYATCPDTSNLNYWRNMWYRGALKHHTQIISSFADGHAGRKPLWAIAEQNCTYNSPDYNAWIQTPTVSHFISIPNSPTQ